MDDVINTTKRDPEHVSVGIVGGGPAGLALAIELGRYGIACIVFEEDSEAPWFPKANSSTARTMEHYRRLGFADEIRNSGLPPDHAQDIVYMSRYSGGRELARLPGLSRDQAREAVAHDAVEWPTPEPLHRSNQIFIEEVLRRNVAKYTTIDARFGWRVLSVLQHDSHVEVQAQCAESGEIATFTCDYLAGCDGARSVVRHGANIKLEGSSNEERDFMGGRMLATLLYAPAFYDIVEADKAWQYVAVNAERRAIMIAIDGKGHFTFHTQLPQAGTANEEWVQDSIRRLVREPFPYEIVSMAEWTAGFTLVAARLQAGARIFLLGDAAHLFTPTGGLGYNTSVEDAANLGWKLAAVCKGWAGPHLLESYEAERKPIAYRNTRYARAMADSLGNAQATRDHEADDDKGVQLRKQLGQQLYQHAVAEFDTPGIQFGVWYGSSPIVISEPGLPPPLDDPRRYEPSTNPGARAPHCWLPEGDCLYDRFGRGFTLLIQGGAVAGPIVSAAEELGLPLRALYINDKNVRKLYPQMLVLIRPDQHIAWRSDAAPSDSAGMLRHVSGW